MPVAELERPYGRSSRLRWTECRYRSHHRVQVGSARRWCSPVRIGFGRRWSSKFSYVEMTLIICRDRDRVRGRSSHAIARPGNRDNPLPRFTCETETQRSELQHPIWRSPPRCFSPSPIAHIFGWSAEIGGWSIPFGKLAGSFYERCPGVFRLHHRSANPFAPRPGGREAPSEHRPTRSGLPNPGRRLIASMRPSRWFSIVRSSVDALSR
jgi:hypothetical protein